MFSARTRRWLLVGLLLLAAVLRFYRLDAQSFWNDEGNSARLVERSLRLIIEGAAGDIHPPGYYLLLHAWWRVAGSSEFALRAFSVYCGLLTVALTAALGRRLGGQRVAVGAALLVAVHPLAVYYSQEARMYALLGLVSALTLWRAERFHARGTLGAVPGLVAAIALGLYTQYAFVFVLLAVNLAFGGELLLSPAQRWPRLRNWITAHLAAGLLFLPWLPHVFKVASWRPPDLDSGAALLELGHTLLAGVTLPLAAGRYLLPLAGALLLLALVQYQRTGSRFTLIAAGAAALLPLLLIAALGVYRPAYLKFLMISVPPLALLLALPLAAGHQGGRLLATLLLFALLPVQTQALNNLYFDPAYAREDYRGLAAHIAAEAGPHDAIALSAPNQWEVFTYYYRGPLAVYPAPYHPTPEEAEAWVAELLAAGHPRLQLLYWGDRESDPERRLEGELARRSYKVREEWVGSVRLALYGTGALPERPMAPLEATLGDAIRLRGYALPPGPFPPGEVLPLTLFWEARAQPETRYKVFVHLLDGDGRVVAQTDAEPVGDLHPTSTWVPGERVTDRYGVLLPPDLPPGRYTVAVGMYDFTGARLPIAGTEEDALTLEQLSVEP